MTKQPTPKSTLKQPMTICHCGRRTTKAHAKLYCGLCRRCAASTSQAPSRRRKTQRSIDAELDAQLDAVHFEYLAGR